MSSIDDFFSEQRAKRDAMCAAADEIFEKFAQGMGVQGAVKGIPSSQGSGLDLGTEGASATPPNVGEKERRDVTARRDGRLLIAAVLGGIVLILMGIAFIAQRGDNRGWTSERTSVARAGFDSACTLGTQRCDAIFDCLKARMTYRDFNEADIAIDLGQPAPKLVEAIGECR